MRTSVRALRLLVAGAGHRERTPAIPRPGDAIEHRFGRGPGIRLDRRVGDIEVHAPRPMAVVTVRESTQLAERSHSHATPAVRALRGNGTTFEVSVPAVAAIASSMGGAERPPAAAGGGRPSTSAS